MTRRIKYFNFNTPSTLKELLQICKNHEEYTAFQFAKSKSEMVYITNTQFVSDVNAFGTWLIQNNHKGEKIALVGENSYFWSLSYLSIVCANNVIVPLDKELPFNEISRLIKDSECTMIIYDSSQEEKIAQIKEESTETLLYFSMDEIPSCICAGNELIQKGNTDFEETTILPEDLACIVYTSGTTGLNKGVMLTHKNICSNIDGVCDVVHFEKSTVILLPLNHTFALVPSLFVPLTQRCTIHINKSLRNVMSDINVAKPITICVVPLFVESFYKNIWAVAEKNGFADILRERIKKSKEKLSQGIDERREDFKDIIDSFGGELKQLICGGAPLNSKYIDGFADFGIEVRCGYGITECSPVLSVNPIFDNVRGSVGKILSCCEVKINEPNDQGIGEIYAKGDNIMQGYYHNDAANLQVFDDGWFKTGDLGYFDENDTLFITGRIKNLIILANGKNVSPEEIEDQIQELSYVKEVLVTNEENYIVANVFLDYDVCKNADTQIHADIEKINANNPHYKKIEKINIRMEEFEKTSTKKIRRN